MTSGCGEKELEMEESKRREMAAPPGSQRAVCHTRTRRRWWVEGIFVIALLQDLAGASDLYSTLRLRKCYCDEYQAWDGTQCLSNNATLLPVYNNDLDGTKTHVIDMNFAEAHPTSHFQNVTVQDIQCSEGLYSYDLLNILLLPDGRLLWTKTNTAIPPGSFCVEHSSFDGSFMARACLPPPAVPRCCPADNLLGQDSSCYPQETLKGPPILVGNHEVDWGSLDGDMESITCEGHEYKHYAILGNGEARLIDRQPTAMLAWRPPVWVASTPWNTKYCVAMQDEDGELQYVAEFCVKDYARHHKEQCGSADCVRKCCSQGSLLYDGSCVEAYSPEERWEPSHIPNQTVNVEWKIVTGELGCKTYKHKEALHLLPNGFLQVAPDVPAVPPSEYCLEYDIDDAQNIENVALICHAKPDTGCLWRDILLKVLMGVSCLFLVATLTVYLGVPELRDQMYGRCLVSLVTAMLTAYLSFIVGIENVFSTAGCYAKAFVGQFSSLAMFFWLNVMCFDMWKILRDSVRQVHSIKMFLMYSVYAWGCPLLISIVTLALDATHPAGAHILPEFYHGSCWFSGNAAYWLYFSGFILVLVVVNIGFFIHVAITLHQKMRQRSQDFENSNNRTNRVTSTKQRMWLFAKLFLVMGVLWINDVLSAITHRKDCTYWVVTDVLNGLQGVIIFIVAVCSKNNLKKIKDAWRPRLQRVQKTILSSRRPTQTNTSSTDDTEDSRKTSITSIPRKLSQVSSILFSSSKKTVTLSPAPDASTNPSGSSVPAKESIPMSTMQE